MAKQPEEKLARALGWGSLALAAPLIVPGAVARAIGIADDDTTRRWLRIVGAREIAAAAGILFVEDDRPRATIYARAAGDVKDLTLLGLAWAGKVREPRRLAAATALVGAIGVADVLAALRLGRPDRKKLAITIRRPAEEVSARWRQEVSVEAEDVRFAKAPGDRGTEVHVTVVAGPVERSLVLNEMRHFKQRLESDNVPRSDGSPDGAETTRFAKQRPAQPQESQS
jgi:hypothetical protein